VIVGILLVYLGVAVLMTWPLVLKIRDHLPGPSNDNLHHYWNGWWMRRALGSGQRLHHTPYLHYPDGLSLVSHDIAWFTVVSWIALEPLLGGLLAYNTTILISLALCGIAAFALAYELTDDIQAAFLAGLVYQNWPFRLYQSDHPNLVATQWIPLFLLFLVRSMDEGRWRHGFLTGVFLALTGYTRWQQLVPAAVLGILYFLFRVPGKLASWRRWGPSLLLGGLVVCLAFAPPALLLIRQQRTDPAALLRPADEADLQTDLLSYVTPSDSHSLLKSFTRPAYARYYPDRSEPRRFPAYIGIVALALVTVGLWHTDRRRTLPWAAMALTLIVLALGPILRINGKLYPAVPMPYRLAARFQLVSLLRFPDRFSLFLALPVAMLAAFGVPFVLRFARQRIPVGGWVTSAILGGAILLEYIAIPIPLVHPDVSPFYAQLAEDRSDFALLNLPLGDKISKPYMFAQVTHQHPIVQGHVSRFPRDAFRYLNKQPWIQALQKEGRLPPRQADVSRQLATLAQDGVAYVVLHKDLISDRIQHWRHYFPTAPRFEDEHILVYPTSMVSGRDFVLDEELAPRMGVLTATLSTACLSPGQPLSVDVAWGASGPVGRDLITEIELIPLDGTRSLARSFPLSKDWPTSAWSSGTVARGYYTLDIPPSLPPYTYTVALTLLDEATKAVQDQALHVGNVVVSDSRCADSVSLENSVNAIFGNRLRLLGYQLRQDREQLNVVLQWHTERLMDTDYKIALEMFDPDTGRRVTRYDGMPGEWTYPTTLWRAGEVVIDKVPLSLEGLPADTYNLSVTVYDPHSGARLPVIASNGRLEADGHLVLPAPGDAGPRRIEAGAPIPPSDLGDVSGPYLSERGLLPQLSLLQGRLKHQVLLAGETVAVHLVWKSTDPMRQDYRLRLALIGENGMVYREEDFDLLDFDYPTSQWQPGDVLQDWYYLPTSEDIPSGDAVVTLNLLDQEDRLVLDDSLKVGTVWLQAVEPSFEVPAGVHERTAVSVGNKVALSGYDLLPRVKSGESAVVTLYWRAQRRMTTSYKVFVHLYDDEGALVAQQDRLLALGIRPTTAWRIGEIVADRYYVPVGSDVSPGSYTVCVGLYDTQTGERLPAVDARGDQLAQNCVILGVVDVEH
jgi:hypothetical protein